MDLLGRSNRHSVPEGGCVRTAGHNTTIAWKGNTGWMDEAACKDISRDVFFPTVGGLAIRDAVPKRAKDLCDSCTVKDECLNFALRNRSLDGIWGGTSEEERQRLRRRRPASLSDDNG
jgi:WhiB family transcriptional regulator, redox-sensing transcriptional regulator